MCRRVIIRELATTCSRMCSVTPMKRRLPWIPKKIKATLLLTSGMGTRSLLHRLPTTIGYERTHRIVKTIIISWLKKRHIVRRRVSFHGGEFFPVSPRQVTWILSPIGPIGRRREKTTSSVRLGRMDERIQKLHPVLSSDQSDWMIIFKKTFLGKRFLKNLQPVISGDFV